MESELFFFSSGTPRPARGLWDENLPEFCDGAISDPPGLPRRQLELLSDLIGREALRLGRNDTLLLRRQASHDFIKSLCRSWTVSVLP